MKDTRSAANPTPVVELPTLEAVTDRLRDVRARLRGHGGDVEVRRIGEGGAVELEFTGACRSCPAIGFTYGAVVEPALSGLAGVRAVKAGQVNLSPFALRRIQRLVDFGSLRGERP